MSTKRELVRQLKDAQDELDLQTKMNQQLWFAVLQQGADLVEAGAENDLLERSLELARAHAAIELLELLAEAGPVDLAESLRLLANEFRKVRA